jgi:hypothetical protein
MNTTLLFPQESQRRSRDTSVQPTINGIIDALMDSFPEPKQLSPKQQREIIARYTAVLEGNFIYWMTATLLAVHTEDARTIILENLHEEVRDAHPSMLRRFAIAAHAFPTDTDALAVHDDLTDMRLFLGRLSGVQSVLAMAFFEGFIQRFMSYLADLAKAQGSVEMEYTDVHGVCDVEHTAGLLRAFSTEMALTPPSPEDDLFEGVYLLRTLIENIVFHMEDTVAA